MLLLITLPNNETSTVEKRCKARANVILHEFYTSAEMTGMKESKYYRSLDPRASNYDGFYRPSNYDGREQPDKKEIFIIIHTDTMHQGGWKRDINLADVRV